MFKTTLIAAGLMVVFGGTAFADTPIGPGVTGAGGTGRDAADSRTRSGAGGEERQLRQDGMPVDRADANARGNARAGAAQPGKAAGGSGGKAGVGASGSSGGIGSAGAMGFPPAEASMGKNFDPPAGANGSGRSSNGASDPTGAKSLPPADASMGK